MKEQAILKINKVGKIGTIVVTVIKVFLIIGMIGTLIGGIACACLPKDLVSMTFSGDAKVNVNLDAVEKLTGKRISEDDVDKFLKKSGKLSVDGKTYMMGTSKVEGENLVIDTKADSFLKIGLNQVIGVCICVFLILAISLVTLTFFGMLCKSFRDCKSPFDENVIDKLQKFAFSLIPWTFINSLAASIVNFIFGKTGRISVDLNLSTVFVVLVVFALAYIFKYGAILQKESDETL